MPTIALATAHAHEMVRFAQDSSLTIHSDKALFPLLCILDLSSRSFILTREIRSVFSSEMVHAFNVALPRNEDKLYASRRQISTRNSSRGLSGKSVPLLHPN
jgi:hypothetical protein